jgi:elongator complex protein 2
MAVIETEYITAGANRHPSTADWVDLDGDGVDGLGILAFGSGRNVAVWRAEVRD